MSRISVIQHDQTDCGAACLASVAKHYRFYVPIAKVRLLAGTDKLGTNMLGLINAAKKLGFEAKGVKATIDSLFKIPLPAIAHVVVDGKLQHYVVIYQITKTRITLMNPSDGKLTKMKLIDFEKTWTGALLILLPSEHFQESTEQATYRIRFWKLIRPHRNMLLQAGFGAIIYTILGLSTSIFVQKITDHVIVDGNQNLLQTMSIFMIAIFLFQSFISVMKDLFIMRTGQQIDVQLILGYYKHLLQLPQHFFDKMRVGEIISRLNDAVKIRVFINDAFMNIVVNFLIIISSFVLMFTYYWKLAVLLLLAIPIYVIIYLMTNMLNKKTQRQLMEQSADLEAQLVESLNSISTIKQFGIETFINHKTDISFIRLLRTIYRSGKNAIGTSISVETSAKLITLMLLWTGATSVLSNKMTTGELFSFYTLTAYFTGPLAAIIGANKMMQEALIAADRLFQIMDLEKETTRPSLTIPWSRLKGDIRFENVCFSYNTRGLVFKDLNLHIKLGSFTAIIGESGSGKSTLLSLLQQTYELDSGIIRIGDYPIKQLNSETLRQYIAVVPQQITLFAGSITENIALGQYQPDMQQIIEICTKLGITKFIENLPNGFDTQLGENGTTLSGGERQKIAIARALYRNPEILILDEATSSLDSVAENYVKMATDLLVAQQKTIVVIAHRLSTIRHADHIIVLNEGVKIEEGNHLQLMRKNGKYSQLWAKQFG